MARITGAVARKESDDKSRRIRRKHQELALAGQAVRWRDSPLRLRVRPPDGPPRRGSGHPRVRRRASGG